MNPEKDLKRLTNETLKNDVCRVCLQGNENLFNIFQSSFDIYDPISIIFEKFLSVKINSRDGYPEVVCPDCLTKAFRALELKMKFEKACFDKTDYVLPDLPDDQNIIFVVQESTGEHVRYICKKEVKHENSYHSEVKYDGQCFCQNCGISFFTLTALERHMVNCFRCGICHATHTNIADMKIHKDIHKRAQETVCPHCGDILRRGYHSQDSFKFPCMYCKFIFPCQMFLTRHIELEHVSGENVKPQHTLINDSNKSCPVSARPSIFSCDECGRNYKVKAQLKIHIMDKHLGIRPHLCCICGKSFVRRGMLKSHQQVHSKEKSFTCDICHKKFVSVATLRYHVRLHTGERPYVCVLCGDSFVKCSRLKEHEQKWHIGKLKCPVCMMTFSQRTSLKTHMDRFHPNTYRRDQDYTVNQGQQLAVERDVAQRDNCVFPDLNNVYTVHITE